MKEGFLRFKDYSIHTFGIVFVENEHEDDGLILSFDVWRAECEYLLDENGKRKEKGFNLLNDGDVENENLLLSGFIAHPPYENKELLNFSFYGTNIDQDEFKELSELLNSDFFINTFNEKNKLYNSKKGR